MSYCRFQHQSANRYGLIEKVGGVETITRTMATSPRSWSEFDGAERGDLPLSQVRLLSPVEPSKVVCIGRNYREHAKELNHPIPDRAFVLPQAAIVRRRQRRRHSPAQHSVATRGLRRRTRGCDRQDLLPLARRRRCGPLHTWLYLRERRNRSRLAGERWSVDKGQRVRHLAPMARLLRRSSIPGRE